MPKKKRYMIAREINEQWQRQQRQESRNRLRRIYEQRQRARAEEELRQLARYQEVNDLAHTTRDQRHLLHESLLQNYLVMPASMRTTEADCKLLFFRSDTRPPNVIFREGFRPRCPHGLGRPVYRCETADIFNPSAVCLTRCLDIAALFPAKVPGSTPAANVYIYAVLCDDYYDTHDLQADIGFSRVGVGRNPAAAQALLYAHEVATMGVANRDVVFAFKVTRRWLGASYEEGYQFRTLSGSANPHTAVSRQTTRAKAVCTQVLHELSRGGRWIDGPTARTYDLARHGYHYPAADDDDDGVPSTAFLFGADEEDDD